ncbi:MAG: beta-ketoacyl-[acyl-carrier-protein] synthase family protein [Candidatus Riflebacteria bacterium]|nr:beta-ketoacyl-[acyl-carrier-protein] synthase family protein [Candidatus Riflebacteria bacterium]
MQRVFITAAGVICPCAFSMSELFDSIENRKSGIRAISRFDSSRLATRFAGEIDFEKLVKPQNDDNLFVSSHFEAKLLIAWNALRQITGGLPGNTSLISTVGLERVDEKALVQNDPGKFPVCPEIPLVLLPGILWKSLGCSGSVYIQAAACSASLIAIGTAYRQIKAANADLIVAGGVDSLIFPFGINSFNSLSALSERNDLGAAAIAPFDKNRSGTLLGEAGAYLVIESEKSAIERNVRPIAEIIGFGASMDAYHPVKPRPDGDGPARAMFSAISDANVSADQIGYVNAHGTGTSHNDIMEFKALEKVFGNRSREIPVSSLKPYFGHTLTASGALETVASCIVFERGIIPPTLNFQTPDPEIPINCVSNLPQKLFTDIIMKNSYSLGGQNASIILKRVG